MFPDFFNPDSVSFCSVVNTNTECDLDESAFMRVDAVVRLAVPFCMSSSISSGDEV